MKKYLTFVAALILLGSCANDSLNSETKSLELKQKLELKVNECVSNNSLSLCVDSVYNDSRCPMDVICVWQGNAAVAISFTLNGSVHQLTLNTGNTPSFPSDTTLQQFKISLNELAPYPISSSTIEQEDYRVSLKVEELED
ncbi:MAG: hypothetical protein JXR22_00450 [Prolixibacteraceae bacterium]|nr:hypothetical protein [Prolixibacteraceae bacterium]